MPRIRINITKANLKRMSDFVRDLKKEYPHFGEWKGTENDEYLKEWVQIMKDEIKSVKDCHDKDIVETYIAVAKQVAPLLSDTTPHSLYVASKEKARKRLVKQYTDKTFDNNIDRYFNEVKKEYIMHPQNECDSLLFCDENREVFLKNNLKLVVNCAKRYQNLGLPFDDLIQAGNEGLLLAFEKFDTSKANLRNAIKEKIRNECEEGMPVSREKAEQIIREGFTYDKLLDQTLAKLPDSGFDVVDDFYSWVDKNVKTAVFASVAFQWIRASILIEITKSGASIKIPGKNALSAMVRLDSMNPYTEDCYHDNDMSKKANEEFIIEDSQLEEKEKVDTFREIIDKAMEGMKVNERRLLRKRFGIGLPYSMSVSELAENEGISISNAKLILKSATTAFAAAFTDEQKELVLEYLNSK